jgi:hypothetical protein
MVFEVVLYLVRTLFKSFIYAVLGFFSMLINFKKAMLFMSIIVCEWFYLYMIIPVFNTNPWIDFLVVIATPYIYLVLTGMGKEF